MRARSEVRLIVPPRGGSFSGPSAVRVCRPSRLLHPAPISRQGSVESSLTCPDGMHRIVSKIRSGVEIVEVGRATFPPPSLGGLVPRSHPVNPMMLENRCTQVMR